MAKIKIGQLNKIIDAYLNIADDKLADGDVLGGIVMINNALQQDPYNKEALMMLADAYSECDLHELAINVWFKYLSVCDNDEKRQAYGGLGLNYYCLGQNFISAYYMNKQVMAGGMDDVDPDVITDFTEDLLTPIKEKKGFAFADEIQDDKMKAKLAVMHKDVLTSNVDTVLNHLDEFDTDSKYYADALNECSLAYMFADKMPEALSYTKKSLAINPDGFDALCNASILYHYVGENQLSAKYEKLAEEKINGEEGKTFRLASSFCEQGKYEKAIKYLLKMLDFTPYDVTLYFLIGITYYNLCEFENAAKYFRKIIQLTNDKRIAGYYLKLAGNETANPDRAKKIEPLPYTFQIPKEERAKRLALVDGVLKGNQKALKNPDELDDALDWCFSTKDPEIERVAGVIVASYSTIERLPYVYDLLLDASIRDSTKKVMLKALSLRGLNKKIKFVYSNIYREIKLRTLSFSKNEDALSLTVIEGYAIAISEIAPLITNDCKRFADVAEDVYYMLFAEYGGKESPFSPECVGAYIATHASAGKLVNDVDKICAVFGCKLEEYNELTKIMNGVI